MEYYKLNDQKGKEGEWDDKRDGGGGWCFGLKGGDGGGTDIY